MFEIQLTGLATGEIRRGPEGDIVALNLDV